MISNNINLCTAGGVSFFSTGTFCRRPEARITYVNKYKCLVIIQPLRYIDAFLYMVQNGLYNFFAPRQRSRTDKMTRKWVDGV